MNANRVLRRLAAASFVASAVLGAVPAAASTISYGISFTDIGTYGINATTAHGWNGSAEATASFDITFDPTLYYPVEPIAGFVSNLSYSVTDNFFSPATLSFNPITSFQYAYGTLQLYSNSLVGTGPLDSPDITISINGWGNKWASSVWYSQNDFRDTLTTSGGVSATPLPASWTVLVAGLVGLGFLARRAGKALGPVRA